MKYQIICFVIAAACISQGMGIAFKDCGTPAGSLKAVRVPGCENVPVCPIHKGTNASVEFDFVSNAVADKATSVVHGVIAHIPVPFAIPNPDACKTADSGIDCPLKPGTHTLTSHIPVLKEYPSLTLTVKWELQDANGNDIFCAMMPLSIQS